MFFITRFCANTLPICTSPEGRFDYTRTPNLKQANGDVERGLSGFVLLAAMTTDRAGVVKEMSKAKADCAAHEVTVTVALNSQIIQKRTRAMVVCWDC